MFPIHNPDSFDFSDWRQVEELVQLEPVDNQRIGMQQPRPDNNQPMMSFSSGSTNLNFWSSGPVSVNIYPGENSHFHFHQTTAPNLNYLQPGPIVQSPPHFSPSSNASGGVQFFSPSAGNSFPSPSFSDAMSISSLQSEIRQVPSAPFVSSSGETSVATSSPDVHRFTPHYSAEWFNEWNLANFKYDEEQDQPSEQSDPANSNGSAVAEVGPSTTIKNPPRQRSRHNAAPVNRPATRAYTRQQNTSL